MWNKRVSKAAEQFVEFKFNIWHLKRQTQKFLCASAVGGKVTDRFWERKANVRQTCTSIYYQRPIHISTSAWCRMHSVFSITSPNGGSGPIISSGVEGTSRFRETVRPHFLGGEMGATGLASEVDVSLFLVYPLGPFLVRSLCCCTCCGAFFLPTPPPPPGRPLALAAELASLLTKVGLVKYHQLEFPNILEEADSKRLRLCRMRSRTCEPAVDRGLC